MYRMSVALVAAALLACASEAQVQIQPKKIQVQPKQSQVQPRLIAPIAQKDNKLTLLENKDVQEDLKLTAEQVKSVKELATKYNEAIKDLKGRDAFQKSRDLIQQNQQAIERLLNGDQNKRLGQLEVQQKGPNAFSDPQVSKEINLTNEQRTEMQNVIRESAKKRTEIIRDNKGNAEKILEKTNELNKSVVEDIVKNLTDGQKGTWRILVGEPFKGTLPAFGGAATTRPGVIINPPVQIQPLPIQIKRK